MTTTTPWARPGSIPGGVNWLNQHEGGTVMELDPSEMGKVVNRLKRAQGQLAGVVQECLQVLIRPPVFAQMPVGHRL